MNEYLSEGVALGAMEFKKGHTFWIVISEYGASITDDYDVALSDENATVLECVVGDVCAVQRGLAPKEGLTW